jgi:hypothetical protein
MPLMHYLRVCFFCLFCLWQSNAAAPVPIEEVEIDDDDEITVVSSDSPSERAVPQVRSSSVVSLDDVSIQFPLLLPAIPHNETFITHCNIVVKLFRALNQRFFRVRGVV